MERNSGRAGRGEGIPWVQESRRFICMEVCVIEEKLESNALGVVALDC